LNNSSKGEPGGNCGISIPRSEFFSVWVVEILTTAGSSFSDKSAKLSGAGAACTTEAAISANDTKTAMIH